MLKTGMSEMETVKSVLEEESVWDGEVSVKETTEEEIAVIKTGAD